MVQRCLWRMVTQLCHIGVGGARWNFWTPWLDCVLCASTMQYFNYIFNWIFILIPLLGGFYFSKNILSDVHTHKCLALRFWEVVRAREKREAEVEVEGRGAIGRCVPHRTGASAWSSKWPSNLVYFVFHHQIEIKIIFNHFSAILSF